jgi:hypothetical protein
MDLKAAYRQSNGHEPAYQILRTKARNEVFQFRDLNLNAEKCRRENQNVFPTFPVRMMKNHRPGIKSLAELSFWCGMPKEELQNHIAWCFKRYGNNSRYVNHDEEFRRLEDVKYSRFDSASIPVTSFQGDKQTIHIVRCTGTNQWRKHKPPRNDTVLLWDGTQTQFKSTRG